MRQPDAQNIQEAVRLAYLKGSIDKEIALFAGGAGVSSQSLATGVAEHLYASHSRGVLGSANRVQTVRTYSPKSLNQSSEAEIPEAARGDGTQRWGKGNKKSSGVGGDPKVKAKGILTDKGRSKLSIYMKKKWKDAAAKGINLRTGKPLKTEKAKAEATAVTKGKSAQSIAAKKVWGDMGPLGRKIEAKRRAEVAKQNRLKRDRERKRLERLAAKSNGKEAPLEESQIIPVGASDTEYAVGT